MRKDGENMGELIVSQMFLLAVCLVILTVGEMVSTKTKAVIPSVFVSAVLFLIGYWTILPKDIIARAGILPGTATMLMGLLITNLGTLLSIKELGKQWRVIVIALGGIIGICSFLMTIGVMIFGWNEMVTVTPPLVGGLVSAVIMSEGATAIGKPELAVLAILIFVMQGFAGYPLTAIMLKKEGRKVLSLYREGKYVSESADSDESDEDMFKKKMFKNFPDKYNTDSFKFLRIAATAALAFFFSNVFKKFGMNVNAFVLCLLFGIGAGHFGFLEKNALQKANGFGLAIMALMLFIFDTLQKATPEMVLKLMYPVVGTIVIGVTGMYVISYIIGKMLKVSKEMSFAVSLTALYGFPANFVLTMEIVNALTDDEKEKKILTQHMLPPMLVAGFITVTIVSVLLAGVMVGWLRP